MRDTAHRSHLQCRACGVRSEPLVGPIVCPCGGHVAIVYDEPADGEFPRLPLARADLVTLGEGGTPVIELPRIAGELGVARLWAKLEYFAPTCSFKDRGSAVLISLARAQGVQAFVEDSSGNAGASMAAYAAAAGLRAHVFAPRSAGQGKKDQIRIFGAELHEIEGPRQAATDAAQAFAASQGWLWLSHNLSPFFVEGMKSAAFELVGTPALDIDDIVFPVGNGSLLVGMYRGLQELLAAGRVRALPRLHAVQSRHVDPIVAAFDGREWSPASVQPTVATGIAVSRPPAGADVVSAVRATGGGAVAVDDPRITAWRDRLAREGVFAELTSAAALAGVEALRERGIIAEGARVLVPVTGSGLKEPVGR